MKVHLIHGIHDSVGDAGLLRLKPYLEKAGFDVRAPDYGYIVALETRLVNPLIERSIQPYIEPGDLIMAHSNGCAIARELVLLGTKPAGLVFFNAALDSDIAFPSGPWVHVYYNPGDKVTEAAQIAAKLGLVDDSWGDMGHDGYTGKSVNVKMNVNCSTTVGMPVVDGHADIFTERCLGQWGPFAILQARRELTC